MSSSVTSPEKSSEEDVPDEVNSASRSQDTLDELLEMPRRLNVDYSVRESDLYYGRATNDSTLSRMPSLSENVEEGQPGRRSLYEWTRTTAARLKRSQREEKGFQVMRPPRTT